MNQVTNPRQRVVLLFGGRSGEHSISCVTAGSILRAIDRTRFEPVPVGISRTGRWTLEADDAEALTKHGSELPEVAGTGPEVLPPVVAGSNIWRVIEAGQVRDLGPIDAVFPLLHGPFGEDGTVQGLLELTDQRYVGSGVLASALGMDKGYMKRALAGCGLPVAPYQLVLAADWQADPAAVMARLEALPRPWFVKPCRAGSSLGISKVDQVADLAAAIDLAASHDPRVLVETTLKGREVECAVLGSLGGRPPRASLPSEIVVAGQHEFYDFDAKYLDGAGADLRCPADLPPEATAQLQALAVAAFQAIGAEGLARIDCFYDASAPPGEQFTINEINTMPGFTPISQYPQMWAVSGLPYTQLISELIDLALDRPLGLR
ncbi:MAG: D-alanine--D-alanine ligase [Bifidobacteriaceae bacterium]|jgi:D-alanine-D-alanine ligase|nr:D-alanine--D-alanine ligase [Bifidobacteriaceae bacterium]